MLFVTTFGDKSLLTLGKKYCNAMKSSFYMNLCEKIEKFLEKISFLDMDTCGID